jgi:hypothetical protein
MQASLKDKDGNYAKFGFKGISETQAPDAAPLQASLGQPPTQQPPPPLQQLWATRRPDKEKRKKHVTLRPRLQTIYMVLAARGYDLLMGECINFGDVLWRKVSCLKFKHLLVRGGYACLFGHGTCITCRHPVQV